MGMNLEQWLQFQQQVHPRDIALGLERIAAVAARLGLGRPARHVISVGGTNGKGSTVAFIEAIARAAGHRVGAYTSPHLLRYNERVRIDGVDATDAALVAAFERIEAARADTPLTYFEFGTLAALILFAEAKLDLAILEVGLGGRLDAVNLVDADVAVVTTVALDHMEWLGRDRESIGVEKAGIFRRGKPAVIGELAPPASLLREVERIGATPIRAGIEYKFGDKLGGKWFWQDATRKVDLTRPRLAAPAQTANAAAAMAALLALPGALSIQDDAITVGVAVANVPARLQRIPGPVEILIDVAHNPQAAQQLAQWMMRNRAGGATQAVFAALADKDAPHMIAPLLGVVDQWRLAGSSEFGPRGQSVEALWRQVDNLLSRTLSTRHDTVLDALAAARAQARPGDRLLVFGSFHTAATALRDLSASA
ncbi:MAG: bifunctional tetrahydrofolate synthase/dihydrofolate synthase [Chiayiivirga sp.]|jgi:dihydrofolate synthase/folylpolyglutamate synthase|uniref:bifunctional tetrahydrofolate synthase/dihydrofolate synthase n=1 Tax=Chiayiivirga sp. TaxID=2041042 RepID=UPI0025BF54A4|nr:bifunctional tetrahydrofolate synthase/dihydrofolate synthase [Chiayiivirga sp.]MCI1728849.1 bifunctional tetrahydrofolate synthase/dihydrofolate synthase [Chiayiivirga sp.]